jgi:hypothetical protein
MEKWSWTSRNKRLLPCHCNLASVWRWLFRVGNEVERDVAVPIDAEVKAPVVVHTYLSEVPFLVVLIGPQRGVVQISEKVGELFVEEPLSLERC